MCRTSELLEQLSEDEIASLKEIGRGPGRHKIPANHAETFLRLGLADLVLGYQEITQLGRRVMGLSDVHATPAE